MEQIDPFLSLPWECVMTIENRPKNGKQKSGAGNQTVQVGGRLSRDLHSGKAS